ncbi:MAG TPA: ABC transporter permease [Candidatus Dependentiae bacterium]|nr:ABC transporter permease [Candidatus Dependentiae bacterium]HRQ62998.1 ABC transporter permease [Candidatus Dependentiae bacterium]
MVRVTYILDYIGQVTIAACEHVGFFTLFLVRAIKTLFTTKLKLHKVFTQMNRIGVESFNIVALTGGFTGMVFALQSYIGFQRVGGEQFIGAVVALGLIRELGPVLTGLMITGRAGSAITAEIGTMRITEQIDALRTLRINTFQYLVVPRILASTLIVPCLTIFAMIFGIVGGYIICVYVLQLSPEDYKSSIQNFVELSDVRGGLIKSSVFGFILAWIGTYKGYYTSGGARGVGIATTQSVVLSSILILVSNYFLTKMLEQM